MPSRHPDPVSSFAFEPSLPVLREGRSREVAAHFGVVDALTKAAQRPTRRRPMLIAPPVSGELALVTGASGSGKSCLLRAIRRRAAKAGTTVLDLRRIPLPERPIIDLFDADATFAPTLKRLARVGLAEVWTWLRPPSQLSEGQRWRLRVALAIARAETSPTPLLIICDEFAAVLDRISACVVSGVLRRAIDANADRLSAVVATSHDDLRDALAPDVLIECDFGEVKRTRGGKGGGR